MLTRKTGDYVQQGDVLAYLHTNAPAVLPEAQDAYLAALTFGEAAPPSRAEIYAYVTKDQVINY